MTATRILIVDDHPMMRDSIRLLLSRQPDLVVVGDCGDRATAWQAVRLLQPDLILVDIDLPDGSGLALTRRIRAKYPRTKVLILTAHLEENFANEAVTAGAHGYLVKTNAPAEILAAVHTVRVGGFHLGRGGSAGLAAGAQSSADPAAQRILRTLPAREGQVLGLLVRGLRNKEIAAELSLNVKTVETYRSRLMKRFACSSPAELVRHAIRAGLAVA